MLKKLLVGAGTLVAALAVATPAHASFFVTISDGAGDSFTVNDNGAFHLNSGSTTCGADTNSGVGTINLSSCQIGVFTLTGNASTSNSPGDAFSGILESNIQLSYNDVGKVLGDSLDVMVFADGYTSPGGPGVMDLSSSYDGTVSRVVAGTGGSLPSSTFTSTGNGTSTTAPEHCDGLVASISTQHCASLVTATTTFTRAGTYTLANDISLSTGPGGSNLIGQVTGTTSATAVPEPGSMLLLGTGLFGLARVARRRFNLGAR